MIKQWSTRRNSLKYKTYQKLNPKYLERTFTQFYRNVKDIIYTCYLDTYISVVCVRPKR